MNKQYTMVDLFAGTGCFSLGFEATKKVKTIFANDFDKSSKTTYDLNFETKLFEQKCRTNSFKRYAAQISVQASCNLLADTKAYSMSIRILNFTF